MSAMRLNENELDLIRRFLDFDLSEKELDGFEDRLDKDAAFKEEVGKFQLGDYIINQFIHQDSPSYIPVSGDDAVSDTDNNPVGNAGKERNWLAILLPILLVIGLAIAGYYFLTTNSEPPVERIFAQTEEYTRSMTYDIMRGEEAAATTTEMSPEQIQLKTIIDDLDAGNETGAVGELNSFVSNSKEASTRELAEWWLVSLYLKNGDVNNAKSVLQRIKDNDDYNSGKKAMEILGELK